MASENILALILLAQYPNASNPSISDRAYSYESTANVGDNPQPAQANQLPPVVLVTMIAIDEASADRLAGEFELGAQPDHAGLRGEIHDTGPIRGRS